MDSKEFEEMMEETFTRLNCDKLIVGTHLEFLRLMRLIKMKAPAEIIRQTREVVCEKLVRLFQLKESAYTIADANSELRDVILKEWAAVHYEAARRHFRKHMQCTEEEFIAMIDGTSTEGYFHSIIGRLT